MPRTTDKADKILEFVNDFIQENGYAPSVREIGQAVGLRSTASVSYHLNNMKESGKLRATGTKGAKRATVTAARPGQIPILGAVRAGLPNLAFEDQEGSIPWNGAPGCFALRVVGDSMIGAHILEDDLVVVRPQQTAEDGEIVVARFEGNATVKTSAQRTFSISGDRTHGDAWQDWVTSLAVMFGTGSTVIVPYVYFSMLTGKGETGKASVIVNGDASNGAGNNAGISVTVSGVEKPKEYTYSAT